jgi:ribosome-associated toxin RatA of RatAB toxin-antitoxin module
VRSRALPGLAGAFLSVLLGAAGRAHAAEDLLVEAQRQGDSVEVRAQATVAAAPRLVWAVLTDYEALPRFIPGITRSTVREKQGGRVVLEQSGEARFFIFSFPIDVRLEVTESPPDWIASHSIAGNLRRMTGRYDVAADVARGTCTLHYRGLLEPAFALPPIVGVAAMRSLIEEQFTAMVAEIERRAAAGAK